MKNRSAMGGLFLVVVVLSLHSSGSRPWTVAAWMPRPTATITTAAISTTARIGGRPRIPLSVPNSIRRRSSSALWSSSRPGPSHHQPPHQHHHHHTFHNNNNNNSTSSTSLQKRLQRRVAAKKRSEIIDDHLIRPSHVPFDLNQLSTVSETPSEEEEEEVKEEDGSSSEPTTTTSISSTTTSLLQQSVETDLYEAVRNEDYEMAHRSRTALDALKLDDSLQILQKIAAFYRAVSHQNLKLLQSLWLPDESVLCIHPTVPPLIGYRAILEGWQSLFEQQNFPARQWIDYSNVKVSVRGGTSAVVLLDEDVLVRRFVRGRRRETELINRFTTTLTFRKVSDSWFIVCRHAGWHADSPPSNEGVRVQDRRQGRASSHNNNNGVDSSTSSSSGPDGILGLGRTDPWLGEGGGGKSRSSRRGGGAHNNNNEPRVVNLSDLLSGGGGGLSDLFQSTSKNRSPNAASGDAIIHIRRLDGRDDDAEEEEDDDDDEEDDDGYYLEADDDGEVVMEDATAEVESVVRRRWRGEDDPPSSGEEEDDDDDDGDSTTRSCIALIRRLCRSGSISPKQKRLLLTDIVRCSAREEESLIEVAYTLLVPQPDGDDDDDDADDFEEDFADQCRDLAESLLEENKFTR